MQRAASTLQFQITANLVEQAGLGRRVEWVRAEGFPELQARHTADPGWKVFKSHRCTPEMAAQFENGAGAGIYAYRDPRDVFASAMRKYQVSFEELWETGFLDEIISDYRAWNALPNILSSSYENIVVDLAAEVSRIAAHLGIHISLQECARIAESYSLQNQQLRTEGAARRARLQNGYLNARFDARSVLSAEHLSKQARVGGWKAQLRASQVARIESQVGEWMLAHGYSLATSAYRQKWELLRRDVFNLPRQFKKQLLPGRQDGKP